ncbi:hypothetical protein CBR_g49763 [Chara braunii]|uniref:Glycoside hydrolase family 3 N-terminal domain-containing protein n=1 Tax=Chara braunii TaxID=69332 RepID=A0A388M608_CHABU|nr:hypothetical protein CBR_g49763 [Chara braunii]|eukprot:GBG89913.1 hypothetical protein CBR_g49763 [Chara braunii]
MVAHIAREDGLVSGFVGLVSARDAAYSVATAQEEALCKMVRMFPTQGGSTYLPHQGLTFHALHSSFSQMVGVKKRRGTAYKRGFGIDDNTDRRIIGQGVCLLLPQGRSTSTSAPTFTFEEVYFSLDMRGAVMDLVFRDGTVVVLQTFSIASKTLHSYGGGINTPRALMRLPRLLPSWATMTFPQGFGGVVSSRRMAIEYDCGRMVQCGNVHCASKDVPSEGQASMHFSLNGMKAPLPVVRGAEVGGGESLPYTAAGDGIGSEHSTIPSLRLRSSTLPYLQDIKQAAGKLLVFGFKGMVVTDHARRLLARGAGGVILYSRNVTSPAQVAELSINLKREAGRRPLAVMVDHEGGSVCRLDPPFTKVPSARMVGATRDPGAAWSIGSVIGRELHAVNIDMNLAPVLDVDTNPANPVIGPRSFGTTTKLVSDMGYSFVRALQQEGVAACGKHFPGHGDTVVDSHYGCPVLKHGLERLESVEIPPFRHAVSADVAAIMLGHIAVPALQQPAAASLASGLSSVDDKLPASLDHGVVQYLRENLMFEGLVVSDCLEMGAITKQYRVAEAAVLAIKSGVDMILVCHTEREQISALDAIIEAVLKGEITYARLKDAEKRVTSFMETYVRPYPETRVHRDAEAQFGKAMLDVVGCQQHLEMVQKVVVRACKATAAAAAASRNQKSVAQDAQAKDNGGRHFVDLRKGDLQGAMLA